MSITAAVERYVGLQTIIRILSGLIVSNFLLINNHLTRLPSYETLQIVLSTCMISSLDPSVDFNLETNQWMELFLGKIMTLRTRDLRLTEFIGKYVLIVCR